MQNKYPKNLLSLISFFQKFPGIGSKSAERLAFNLLRWDDQDRKNFGELIDELKNNLSFCQECGALENEKKCPFCTSNRNPSMLCILSSAKDVYSIEQTQTFRGIYHVLPHLLSPLDQHHLDAAILEKLRKRIVDLGVKEILLAFDPTLEGDATALYLKSQCADWNVPVTRLALGLPVGSSLEYVDAGTLSRAIDGRQFF